MCLYSGPTALAPGDGVQIGRKEDGVRHAFCPPTEAGGAVLLFFHGIRGPLTLCLWSRASI